MRKLILLCLVIMLLSMIPVSISLADGTLYVLASASETEQVKAVLHQEDHVAVMLACTGKEVKILDALSAETGISQPTQLKLKKTKKNTEKEYRSSWNTESSGYSRLVTAIRKANADQVVFCPTADNDVMNAAAKTLLLRACADASDPRVRGIDGTLQFCCRISEIVDFQTKESSSVTENEWMRELTKKWGEQAIPNIPSCPALNSEGFADGEPFSYIDEEQGVWFYVSSELRVTITRHKMQDKQKHIWFEADVVRKPDSDEYLHCVSGSTNPKRTAYAEEMSLGWVVAMNSDYHYFRLNNHHPIGLIVRDGEIKYGDSLGKAGAAGMPNLDCAMLKSDGSFSVHLATTLTGEDALSQGVSDVLSFGPLFIQNGIWCQVNASYHSNHEPRSAIGKISDNHYLLIFAEGRLDEAKGMSLDELQELFLVRGATDALNLDGGRTACMFFMGEQVGSVGSGKKAVSPRGQWEMLVIGNMQ